MYMIFIMYLLKLLLILTLFIIIINCDKIEKYIIFCKKFSYHSYCMHVFIGGYLKNKI